MKTATLFGIKNCDTVKKARKWLDAQGIDYQFHDFRADGLDAAQVDNWRASLDWETLLNRRGATWRNLPPETRAAVNTDTVTALLVDHSTLIKRPVLTLGTAIKVGFKDAEYEAFFKENAQ